MQKLKSSIAETIDKSGLAIRTQFEIPPSVELGDLALPLQQDAKLKGVNPSELSRSVSEWIESHPNPFVSESVSVGGYVNFRLDTKNVAALAWSTIRSLGESYGCHAPTGKSVIVEHTSANPIHPLHIGAARNSVFGDTLVRLQRARGHAVRAHFYVDDTGRQTAIAAFGYQLLGEPVPSEKPDHWIGKVYTVSSAIVEVLSAKEKLHSTPEGEDAAKLRSNIDEWMSVLSEQARLSPDLTDGLSKAMAGIETPQESISRLISEYEEGRPLAKRAIRKMVDYCLSGFKETLVRAGIHIDSFDYESDLLWDDSVGALLDSLEVSKYVAHDGRAMIFDVDAAANDFGLKEILGVQKSHVLPRLVLTRRDGTTLYVTRDLAYSLKKLDRADRVLNVIGTPQTLAQLQLKVVLYALGYKKVLEQIHVPYEQVELPTGSMSGRRGHYVAFDSILDEAKSRAKPEVAKRNPEMSAEVASELAEKISVAAVRFALVGVGASKKILFTWDRVLDFEANSGPYALYTFSRANSILQKSGKVADSVEPDFGSLKLPDEHRLAVLCARLPENVAFAADTFRPEVLSEYIMRLCDVFNSYYGKAPVLGAPTAELKDARLVLVRMVHVTLRSAFNMLGVPVPQRM